jgi:membrane protein DedA with SNARE-associated domain
MLNSNMFSSNMAHALLIFVSTFVLEDIAVLGAALLVVNSMVTLPWAAASSFAGIWIGDFGLYVIARHFGRPVFERSWFKRLIGKKIDLARSEGWFRDHGTAAIVISRAVPGTRLPTYLAAGLLKVPLVRFLTITGAACVIWVAVLFGFSYHVGMMVISEFAMFRSEAGKLGACVVLAAVLGWMLRKVIRKVSIGSLVARLKRWEFWPPVVFYVPVAAKYLALAIKYRSFSLPTLANPGMYMGGVIGESKFETLADLSRAHLEAVAETHLVRFDSVEQQTCQILRIRKENDLPYPLVLKPDVGQRGYGFKVIHSDEDIRSYVACFTRDVLVQKYAPGPLEAGIFYYRFPQEREGRIFAITEKVFPAVTGDGRHTLEELIRADSRASLLAGTYLHRFATEKAGVPAAGESFRLVEAGNHCQGAIFLEGGHLLSVTLAKRIDEISQSIPGFFVGRFDVRYSSEEALREGRDFQIIELNGASSEATNIYDPRNSLWNAYRTLFRQWEIVFAIADENRRRGLRTVSVRTILEKFSQYRRQAALHPVSD